MRIHDVSEGDVEGAVYCYLIPYCFTLQYYTARVSGEPKPSSYKWGWWWRGDDVQRDQEIHGMFSRFLSMSALCHIIELIQLAFNKMQNYRPHIWTQISNVKLLLRKKKYKNGFSFFCCLPDICYFSPFGYLTKLKLRRRGRRRSIKSPMNLHFMISMCYSKSIQKMFYCRFWRWQAST